MLIPIIGVNKNKYSQLYIVLWNVDLSTKVKHWAEMYFDQPDEKFAG